METEETTYFVPILPGYHYRQIWVWDLGGIFNMVICEREEGEKQWHLHIFSDVPGCKKCWLGPEDLTDAEMEEFFQHVYDSMMERIAKKHGLEHPPICKIVLNCSGEEAIEKVRREGFPMPPPPRSNPRFN